VRERLIALREQRMRLLGRASAERESLAGYVARAEAATGWLEKGMRLVAGAKRRPLWVAAGIAVLVALRPKSALKWLASGWSLWQAYRGARLWVRRLAPALLAAAAARREA